MEIPETPQPGRSEQKGGSVKPIVLWCMLMVMYVFMISGIGYITFWEQDFNDPEKVLMTYEDLREKHYQVLSDAYGSDLSSIEDDSFNQLVNECIKDAINASGDLQELASQSFHIVLGAMLAFLSATATMVFQGNQRDR